MSTHETEQLLCDFFIPGGVPSKLNLREHWAAASDRAKRVRSNTRLVAPRLRGPAPLCVKLTRYGFRKLDGDNLQGALKAHRDAVAAWLRIDDASPLVEWLYEQTTTPDERKHGVSVELVQRGSIIVQRVEVPIDVLPIL